MQLDANIELKSLVATITPDPTAEYPLRAQVAVQVEVERAIGTHGFYPSMSATFTVDGADQTAWPDGTTVNGEYGVTYTWHVYVTGSGVFDVSIGYKAVNGGAVLVAQTASLPFTLTGTTQSIDFLNQNSNTTTVKMKQKNFFQTALSAFARLGKGNGGLKWDTDNGRVAVVGSDEAALVNMAAAEAVSDDDVVVLSQVRRLIASGGAVIVSALVPDVAAWPIDGIRITADLEFQRKLADGTAEAFNLADGQAFTVAKAIAITAGGIINKAEETALYEDHVYIWDATTAKVYDNGAIGDPTDWTGTEKAILVTVAADGTLSGASPIPANATVTDVIVFVTDPFTDGAGKGIKTLEAAIMLDGFRAVDFAELDVTEVAKLPVPTLLPIAAQADPTIVGDFTAVDQGQAKVLVKYLVG